MTDSEITEMLERHAREIGEHVEAVQILATNTEGSVCGLYHRSCGNLYARKAIAQEFVNELDAGTLANEHMRLSCPEGDDGEEQTV